MSQTNVEKKLWEKSLFYIAPGEGKTFFYVALIHVATIVGLFFFPLPSLNVLIGAIALTILGGLGTSLAYHRALTHKGLEINPIVEQVLIFFAVLNGSGTPMTWVANHRRHHMHSDTEEDISSPYYGGFLWSHLLWLWQSKQSAAEKYCPDINKKMRYRIWNQLQVPALFLSFFFGAYWGGMAWLWLGPLRLVFALHVQCTVNSLCHLGKLTDEEAGSSKNIWWLTPFHLGLGENWHANHHTNQTNPRIGVKFWQVDITWMTIVLLNRLGLVNKLKKAHH